MMDSRRLTVALVVFLALAAVASRAYLVAGVFVGMMLLYMLWVEALFVLRQHRYRKRYPPVKYNGDWWKTGDPVVWPNVALRKRLAEDKIDGEEFEQQIGGMLEQAYKRTGDAFAEITMDDEIARRKALRDAKFERDMDRTWARLSRAEFVPVAAPSPPFKREADEHGALPFRRRRLTD